MCSVNCKVVWIMRHKKPLPKNVHRHCTGVLSELIILRAILYFCISIALTSQWFKQNHNNGSEAPTSSDDVDSQVERQPHCSLFALRLVMYRGGDRERVLPGVCQRLSTSTYHTQLEEKLPKVWFQTSANGFNSKKGDTFITIKATQEKPQAIASIFM